MSAAVFESWFSDILRGLEEDAVVVMDNAPYHNRKLENNPNTGTKKVILFLQYLRN
jgi:predicted O-methyltransferase YrrM